MDETLEQKEWLVAGSWRIYTSHGHGLQWF
jgi:hypothetical protein